ncbi:MAG TPA: ABC transporter ATP-binding protein, partial [Clostridia bacterium]
MSNQKKTSLKRLFGYIKPYKKTVICIAFLSLIGNLFYVIGPLLIGRAVDNIVEAGKVDFDNLIKILIILGGLYIINALCVWLYTSLGVSVAVKTTNKIRKQAFKKLLSLPLKEIDNMNKGDIISRFTADCDQITDAITQMLNQFFSGIVIIFAALGFMLYLSPIVTIAVVISVPLMFWVSKLVAQKSSQRLLKMQQVMGKLSGYAEEHIRGARVVKAFNYEKEAQRHFDIINDELNITGTKAQFIASLSNPSTRLLNYFSYSLVGLTGGLCAIFLGLSVGTLTSFLTYATLFSRPINEFTSATSQIISGLAGASRMFEIIDITSPAIKANQGYNDIVIKGDFEFKDVDFSYIPQKPLIKDFNLDVKQGQKVAIVGPTGAGKTTMINLLMRFYDVN